MKVNTVFSMNAKPHKLNAFPKVNLFDYNIIWSMLYSIEDREDLEKIDELVSIENQVKVVRLQDKLGKQNFHADMKKVFQPVTKSIKDVSEEVTKTMTENSIRNNQALEKLNNKLLEIKNDRGLSNLFDVSII